MQLERGNARSTFNDSKPKICGMRLADIPIGRLKGVADQLRNELRIVDQLIAAAPRCDNLQPVGDVFRDDTIRSIVSGEKERAA
jgi:hypothetical protein